ncbi:glycosyltransferase, partial [bacterium]|nr:glycosyltransferase [bacterium]
MKLSIVVPVYNEKSTILKIIEKVIAVDVEKEIIIVDDCST